MSEIEFIGIAESEREKFKSAFEYLAKSKTEDCFEESVFAEYIGDKVTRYFVNPTKEEADEMLAKWKLNSSVEMPWDFGSWFAALESAEIEYQKLELKSDGAGKIVFEQLAWPSGGIEATIEFVKAFGGEVTSNNAI